MERLKSEVGKTISDQLSGEWTPEFCRFYDLQRIGRLWYPSNRKDYSPPPSFWDNYATNIQQKEKEQKMPAQKMRTAPKLA